MTIKFFSLNSITNNTKLIVVYIWDLLLKVEQKGKTEWDTVEYCVYFVPIAQSTPLFLCLSQFLLGVHDLIKFLNGWGAWLSMLKFQHDLNKETSNACVIFCLKSNVERIENILNVFSVVNATDIQFIFFQNISFGYLCVFSDSNTIHLPTVLFLCT